MPRTANITIEQVIAMRNKGLSIDKIADELGVSRETVRKRAISGGVAPRGRGRHKQYPIDEAPVKITKPLPKYDKVVVTDLSDWKELTKALIVTLLNEEKLPIEWVEEYNEGGAT